MSDPNDGVRDRQNAHLNDPDSTVQVPNTARPVGGTATGDADETEVVSRDQLRIPRSGAAAAPPSSAQRPGQTPPQAPPVSAQQPQWPSPAPTPPPSGQQPYPGAPMEAATPNQPPLKPGTAYPPAPPAGYGPPPAGYASEPPQWGPPQGASAGPGYGPPPGYGDASGQAGQAGQPHLPPPPRDYAADARAALNRGNSFLGRLLRRGVNGELIPIAAFQSYRMHKPVPLTVAVFVIGLILAGVFSQSGGLIGLILSEAIWAITAYVLIAIGTKGALQTIVYGICLLGALGFAAAAYIAFTSYATFSSLPYSSAASGLSIGLLIIGIVAAVLAVVHGYIGIQVHREIKKIAAGQ